MGRPKQKQITKKVPQNESNGECEDDSQDPSEQQVSENIQSLSRSQEQDQQSDESSPIEAAIKTISFRARRGSKMKDLIKGKIEKDQFWEKNNVYFGGDLRGKDEDQHESEYQASSSGRDQFDSDFDLTDSYPGKRGRKKGQKIKRKIKRNGQARPRGRPRKAKEEVEKQDESDHEESNNHQIKEKKKKIYKQVPNKPNDAFIIYKSMGCKKKSSKVTKSVSKDQDEVDKQCKMQQE